MLPKTATARNMFAIVAAGVATTVATAGVLLWLSYRTVEERSISESRAQRLAESRRRAVGDLFGRDMAGHFERRGRSGEAERHGLFLQILDQAQQQ